MGIDLQKEIKLSDLFKRRAKAESDQPVLQEVAVATPQAAEPKAERRLSLKRAPKAPKEPKVEQSKASKGQQEAGALPEIPLMRAFNLLPKDDPRDARRGRPRPAQLVLAVVSVLLLAGVGGAYMVTSAGVKDKRATRDDLAALVADLEKQVAAKVDPVKSNPALATEKNVRSFALGTALARRVAWDRLLREVSLVTPEDVWLSGLVSTPPSESGNPLAEPGQSGVTVNGYTYDQARVAQMLSRLALVPELAHVQLVSSTTSLIGDKEVVQFSISALVKLPEGASA